MNDKLMLSFLFCVVISRACRRVSALEEALALASNAGFHHQMGFKS
jgi:hypothetical protein